jgi:hypothetical protein|tara:strand:- start:169 stop:399 length:231 start_codon:yes stop_codon:yes gene_type:complete
METYFKEMGKSVHSKYYSRTSGTFISVQDMNEAHVRNALQKMLDNPSYPTKVDIRLNKLKQLIYTLAEEANKGLEE